MAHPKMHGGGLERVIDTPRGSVVEIHVDGPNGGRPFAVGIIVRRRFAPNQPENSATIVELHDGTTLHLGSGTAVSSYGGED